MKKFLVKPAAYILAICLIMLPLPADVQSNIPSSGWEQHSEGVAVAMLLSTKTESDSQKGALHIFIKNTSTVVKYLPNTATERAIEIFYVDSSGKQAPLRDYTVRPQNVLASAIPHSRPYQPNEVDEKTIELSASELATVKEHQVVCLFYISNQQIGGYSPIKTSPRMLTSGP